MFSNVGLRGVACAFVLAAASATASGDDSAWPRLPEVDGAVEIPAQEWPLRPGPRTVRVLVHYPGGKLAGVGPATGVMLTLHNWGGVDCVGTADPRQLANRFNLVALCVNYLQSGPKDSIEGPEPYDFGYLQSLDALRALYFALHNLRELDRPFAAGRIYCTGGSGGGNVALMANKLAPHTFAAVVDLCGMKKLSDDIAYHLPGGSSLNARYVRDPSHPYRLTRDEQELRFVGHPDHVRQMSAQGAAAKVIVVHGTQDTTCPFAEAVEMVDTMRRAGLDVETKYVRPEDLDGQVFTSAGHALGNRTEIAARVAGKYLAPEGPERRLLPGPDDFARRSVIRYPTSNGEFVISYKDGWPVGRFEPAGPTPAYSSHQQLDFYLDAQGQKQPIRTPDDWARRRQHIRQQLQAVMGPFPSALQRVPLDVKVVTEQRVGRLVRRKITYQSDADDRVPAWLIFPADVLDEPADPARAKDSPPVAGPPTRRRLAAVLCLHQTTAQGKNEAAGVAGNPDLKYALELAERGFVTLAPDYPSLGEHAYDFAPSHGYVSGSMKAIWDNSRAIDFLETLDFVDPRRIGCIGHSLGGHNGVFTAVFDERLRAVVSSCGFSSMTKDDVPSWNGPRYMPRIAAMFGNDAARLPFDFHEIIAALAPRSVFVSAATRDTDFDVTGVRDAVAAALPVFELHGAAGRLVAHYPEAPHSFPADARRRAYEFLEDALVRPLRVALIGDSTVASYPNPPPDRPDLTGWGQVFGDFFEGVEVLNHARSGRSSKSFLAEGHWPKVLADKPDYVFIQFGHNDGPGKGDRSTDPTTDFQDNLRRYIDEARQAGVQPVLVTPVARRTFAEGRPHDSLRPYADATKSVARERRVPLVDLHAASLALLAWLGDQGSAELSASATDRTHFSRQGGLAMASLVADELPAQVPALAQRLRRK